MKLIDQGVCIWLLPDKSGRVRKVRISPVRVAIIALSSVLILGFITFLTFDYSRLAISRHLTNKLLSSVTEERNSLSSLNGDLKTQVEDLRVATEKVRSYKEKIKQRIEILSSILESATPADIFQKERIMDSSKEGGVGGLEIECTKENIANGRCPRISNDARAMLGPVPEFSFDSDSFESDQSFLETLDSYIGFLRSLPIGIPADGWISSNYGLRRSPFSGRITMHEGVDFSLPAASDIRVTGDGVVAAVRRTSTYGLEIDVRHSDRIVTRYAHLSRALVKEGDRVCRGKSIALVGSTGRSTGPHLHYEIIVDGKQSDPKNLLSISEALDTALIEEF